MSEDEENALRDRADKALLVYAMTRRIIECIDGSLKYVVVENDTMGMLLTHTQFNILCESIDVLRQIKGVMK